MLVYHDINKVKVAELLPGSGRIGTAEDMLGIMAEAGYSGSSAMIIYEANLPDSFFDLSTKIAGEILQKFSNYRMRLAIIGSFTDIQSKSLRDFIRESNRTGTIIFVGTFDEAISGIAK